MSTPPYQPPEQPWSQGSPEPTPPPPYGQPGQYGGYQPYGGGMMEHPQGTMILILGILSLVICGLLGPVAWIMGNNAIAEIDRNPMAYTNRGTVQAGRICGIIATVIIIVTVVFVVILMAATASSS